MAIGFESLLDSLKLPNNLIPQWAAFKGILVNVAPVIRSIENFFPSIAISAGELAKQLLAMNGINLGWLKSLAPFLENMVVRAGPAVWWIGAIMVVLDLLKKLNFGAKIAVNTFTFLIEAGNKAVAALHDAFGGLVRFITGGLVDALQSAALILGDLFAPQQQPVAMVASGDLSAGLLSGMGGSGQGLVDLGATSTKASEVISQSLQSIGDQANLIGQNISDTYTNIIDSINQKIEEFKQSVPDLGAGFGDIWGSITKPDLIFGAFKKMGENIKQGIKNLFERTVGALKEGMSWLLWTFLWNLNFVSAGLLALSTLFGFLEADISNFIKALAVAIPSLAPIEPWLQRFSKAIVRFLPALTAILIQLGKLDFLPNLPMWFYTWIDSLDGATLALFSLIGQLYTLSKAVPVVREIGAAIAAVGKFFQPVFDLGSRVLASLGDAIKAAGGIRTHQQAVDLILAGATRLGTSWGIDLLKQREQDAKAGG